MHRSTSLPLCECRYYPPHPSHPLSTCYRSHVSWRQGHGDTEASADIGPCIIYEEDTVSSSSSREDRDNLSNVMEEKQQELFGPSPTL